ncbi:hypothetical protein [Microbispora hainanensis]|uniref:Uncharacterized protein n=1 Tax=Microbispora hainanensis TaxID=568844 RepID=A0A544YDM5_9ACTN|nr:hypothetical protein [Microbispora hainanensis]TQS14879.1 hypothetical protein FLX08_33510 [Microbispora hainanensis]
MAAVRRLLSAQSSVKVAEWGEVQLGSRSRLINHTANTFKYDYKRTGSIQLGRTGVVASDLSRRLRFERDDSAALVKKDAADGDPVARSLLIQTRPHRSVSVNGRLYTTGPLYAPALPKGKTWALRGAIPNGGAFTDQVVNIFEPRTLKKLLSDTYSIKRSGFKDITGRIHENMMLYRGKITFADLYAVSPTFRTLLGQKPDATLAPALVWWWLWTDKNGTPMMVDSSWDTWVKGGTGRPYAGGSARTEYLAWRPRVTIKAPRSSLVAKVAGPANGLPEIDDAGEAIRDRRG